MQKRLLCAGILLALISPAFAQTKTATAEEAVLQLTRDWLNAEERRDRAALKLIIADDFQGTAPRGNTVFKEDVLPAEGAESGGLAITTSDVKARVFGDTAIVTARGISKVGEKGELRFTVVFAKRDNRWQMVAGHLSTVPKAS